MIQVDSFDQRKILISDIQIIGLKRTKTHIVEREIGFARGDSIFTAQLQDQLYWVKNRVFNTGLFLSVALRLRNVASDAILEVEVKERYYTYPVPIVDIADRNFNEWWEQRGHDWRRLDLGLYLKQKNLRGRNETLKLKFTVGFNKKIEVHYQFPYINKKMKTGLSLFTGVIVNRQVAFRSFEDKLEYLETGDILRTRVTGGFYFTRRNNFYTTHQVGVNYLYTQIADTIATANPYYLLDTASSQHSVSLRYQLVHDRRDFAKYAWKGYYLSYETEVFQHTTNRTSYTSGFARLEAAHYQPFGKRWNWSNGLRFKFGLPSNLSYFNQRGFGYKEDYVSGYQLYVIDGTQFYLGKSHLRWKLLSWSVNNTLMPLRKFKQTPFSIYLKMIGEAGYVVQSSQLGVDNTLGNTWLYGYGLGIDCSTYYDVVGRLEFTVNHLQQAGIYLHVKSAF